jgi:YaiO family outer membrane protein
LLTLDVRQARYRIGDIQTLNPGVDQYLANGRLWIGARWINIFDQDGRHHSGWLVRGDMLATERLRLFAGAADAPDTSEGFVTEVSSLFGGFAYDVNERFTVRASVAHDDRDTGADRLQFGLGAGIRF